jgi:hypothetical protein
MAPEPFLTKLVQLIKSTPISSRRESRTQAKNLAKKPDQGNFIYCVLGRTTGYTDYIPKSLFDPVGTGEGGNG